MDRIENNYNVVNMQTSSKICKVLQDKNTNMLFFLKKCENMDLLPVYKKLKSLNHPHIPMIQDIIIEENYFYIVEEYINAPTLFDVIQEKIFDDDTTMDLIVQLCDILHTLHNLNPPIIHRDISLDNILYRNGEIFLIDFNASRFYKDGMNHDTTLMAKKYYTPPEQFGFGQSGAFSDVYSLGVCFIVMATGLYPLSQFLEYNGKYLPVYKKMTNVNVNRRYKSMKDVKTAILLVQGKAKGILAYFTNPSKAFILLCTAVYVLVVIFFMEFADATPINTIIYKSFFLSIPVLGFALMYNFSNIRRFCFLSNCKNKYLKAIGIIISFLCACLVEMMILGSLI